MVENTAEIHIRCLSLSQSQYTVGSSQSSISWEKDVSHSENGILKSSGLTRGQVQEKLSNQKLR